MSELGQLINALERVKRLPAYALNVFYGENIGFDDVEVAVGDRRLEVSWSPFVNNGSIRVVWCGSLKEFLVADMRQMPQRVPMPPHKEDLRHPGYYVYGSDQAVESFRSYWMNQEVEEPTPENGLHDEPSPLAGKEVTFNNAEMHGNRRIFIEDWWDRVSGESWRTSAEEGVQAACVYAARLVEDDDIPRDNQVLYGKLGNMGCLVHESEIAED